MSKAVRTASGHPNPTAALSLLGLAMVMTVPGIVLRSTGFHPADAPVIGMFVFGMCVVASAFVLTWAAEVAELDIGSGLAVVFLALVTVLPEYAVDGYFAWKAGYEAEYEHYALANMTGANRLLIGTGWPIVALIVWYRQNRRSIHLRRQRSGDIVWLLVATLYSLTIPLKRDLCWYDAVVLVAIYAAYVRGSASDAGGSHGEADLVGPPVVMARWAKRKRRTGVAVLFLWSAGAILAAAEPFSESLVAGGKALGVHETFLVQWLAPLASEAPEFVVVVLLTLRGRAEMGLGAFISSKVNQWTLLVGTVPLVYGLSKSVHGAGFAPCLAMDDRMTEELWLTAAQGLYAVATIADLDFSLKQALAILGLFLVQTTATVVLEMTGRHGAVSPLHVGFSILYGVLALERFVSQRRHLLARVRDVRNPPAQEHAVPERGGAGGPDESDA